MAEGWPGELGVLAADVLADGRIDAEDALKLRRALCHDGELGLEEAQVLLHLNRSSAGNDPAWAELFVDALADFFYWREDSDGGLTPDAERLLMAALGPADEIDEATGLRLLRTVLARAGGTSERFRAYVQAAVAASARQGGHGEARCALQAARGLALALAPAK